MRNKDVGFGPGGKEKFKQKFPIITDKDLNYKEGREGEMIELVGYKPGKTNQELLNIMVNCCCLRNHRLEVI
jgi:hypothetical protein